MEASDQTGIGADSEPITTSSGTTFSEPAPASDVPGPGDGTVDDTPVEPVDDGPEFRVGTEGDQGEWHEAALEATDDEPDNDDDDEENDA